VALDLLRLQRLFGTAPPPFRLAGRRTVLRAPDRLDWRAWVELRHASRTFLTPWEPSWGDDALSRAAFRRRLARYALEWHSDQGYTFLLFRLEDDALVGGISLTNVRRGVAESASVGYWVGEPHARQGYMSEGLTLTLRFAFERLRLHRIEAACLPHNAPSRGLLLKTGFTEEGYAREYLCIDGKWQDHVLFGILAHEWTKRNNF
jgi:[ribosomal protein S5]-alanine N-acetyltransferase